MRILLTADPMIPVPPVGYGGIERIVDALARTYLGLGHSVGLAAHRDSACAVDAFFPWSEGPGVLGHARHALALAGAARSFQADVVHSFSRLAYLAPLLPSRLPKVMSYQRHVGGRQIAIASALGGRSLHFTGCSEFIAAQGRRAGGTWTAIPNFVEPDKIPFSPGVPADAPLLFLSRIEDTKGPDVAIAIARACGRRLILAGNAAPQGVQRAFFEAKVAPFLGKDRIEWVGEVNDAQKADLLGRAAALLVPIQWDEPFGIVFAEAMAAGTPVITCPRGAVPEIVVDGKTGFLIQGVEDGVRAVGRLGELDRSAGRRRVEELFTVGACAARYLRLFGGMTA